MSTCQNPRNLIVSPAVRSLNLISSCDQLLFTGTYNRNNFFYGDGNTTPVLLESYPKTENTLNIPYTLFPATPVGLPVMITEQYNLTSWSEDYSMQEGYIIWGNTYPNGDSEYTSQPAILFPVLAADGIFSRVTKVAIDYTEDNRILYFYASC
jgi:hypothetical protein